MLEIKPLASWNDAVLQGATRANETLVTPEARVLTGGDGFLSAVPSPGLPLYDAYKQCILHCPGSLAWFTDLRHHTHNQAAWNEARHIGG